MNTYATLDLLSNAAAFIPAAALVWLLRPARLRDFATRGGKMMMAAAFAVDTGRRLLLFAYGVRPGRLPPLHVLGAVIPGPAIEVVNLGLFGLAGLLLWLRLAIVINARAGQRDAARRWAPSDGHG